MCDSPRKWPVAGGMRLKRLNRRWLVAGMTLAAAAVPAAAAAHWPTLGGDAGRSGNETVGDGGVPVHALYSKTDANVVTPVVTSAGAVATQRLAYGTANGHVHLRRLESGAAVGPAAGVDVDGGATDPDAFGPGVGFAETSRPGALGQLLVVHNDNDESATGDISIAQVDESSGALVKQVPVAGTAGFTIRSSAVVTTDARALFFVAENGDDERLFRVPLANATGRNASFGTPTSTADVDADPQASPTVVWLRDAAGNPRRYVAVGATNRLRTFSTADLSPGPASADLGDSVRTPSVPVQRDGTTPRAGGAVRTAPAIYAAARVGGSTVVHRLVQNGNAQSLATAASSPALGGAPAPALATSVEAAPSGPTAGRVVVTTGQNLYVLDGASLAQAGAFASGAQAPGTTGFGQTTAAVSDQNAYVTTDDGRQLVLKLADGQPVASEEFTENPVNGGARPASSAFGQPSVSRSFVQFGGPRGLFVYVNRCGNPVFGSQGADRIIGTVAGAYVEALGGNDRVSAAGSDDCVFGGAGNDALSGNSGDDRVSAHSGDDRVYGRSGDDGVSGNAGNDRIAGGPGDDVVYGREDDDRAGGNAGADTIRGGTGDDRVVGGSDADAMSGNSGDDRLSAGAGNDRVFGRSGRDGVSGNSGDDRVSAGGDDDRVFGRGGADAVSGNSGDDRISGGPGIDRIYGRSGNDRIDSRDGDRDVVHCGYGRDYVRADREDVLTRCERRSRR